MRGYNEYIGARYVPKFDGDWDNTKEYEPLMIVSYQGNSYTSKTFVPKSVAITDEKYWACTGNYNAQVEAYRQEVENLSNDVDELDNILSNTKLTIIRDFQSVRLCRYENYGAQSLYKNGNNFITTGETIDKFYIDVFDSNFDYIGRHEYNYNVHPNSIIKWNGKLYIVDSNNSDIYVINSGTYELLDIITDFETLNIYSATINGDNAYIYGQDTLYKLIDEHSVETGIVLETIPITSIGFSPVQQGVCIINNCIYKIFNSPNILVKYDMTGKCVGVVPIGIGNGYYPYGEIESLCVDGDNVLLLTALYSGDNESGNLEYSQIFKCNLGNNYVGNNSDFGQQTPKLGKRIYCIKNSTDKNPNGDISHPFSSAYEASCVYNYLYNLYGSIRTIIFDGDFSNDSVIFVNCHVANQITGSLPKFKKIFLFGCTANLLGFRSDYFESSGSIVNLINYRNDNYFNAMQSVINFTGGLLNGTNFRFYYSEINGDYIIRDSETGEYNTVYMKRHLHYGGAYIDGDDVSINPTLSNLYMLEQGSATRIEIDLSGGANAIPNTATLWLLHTEKSTINNNGTVTKNIMYTGHDGTKAFYIPITVKLTKSDITLSKGTPIYTDGTAFVGNSELYCVGLITENIVYYA